jgi:hypothetical protein
VDTQPRIDECAGQRQETSRYHLATAAHQYRVLTVYSCVGMSNGDVVEASLVLVSIALVSKCRDHGSSSQF